MILNNKGKKGIQSDGKTLTLNITHNKFLAYIKIAYKHITFLKRKWNLNLTWQINKS